jgi:hypothetical protein
VIEFTWHALCNIRRRRGAIRAAPSRATVGIASGVEDTMRNTFFNRWTTVAAAAGSLLFGGTVWANAKPEQEVRQVGATSIVYHGPQVNIALSYRYPKFNPEAHWLMLDTVMAAARDPIEVPRNAISLRTPSGLIIPLATPREYNNGYRQLAWSITKDNATREPLGLLLPLRYRPLRFFPPSGIGLMFDSEWLDDFHNSYGRLFFKLPGTVHKGTYELLIELPESNVVIPFTI